jgi:hypothetical protein
MDSLLIHYPVDLTGRNPTNLTMGEPHFLVNHSGISQRVVVLDHGGFYTRDLMVYDKEYNRLKPNIDYVATYTYEDATFRTGLEICGALVFLNPELDGMVYVTAQIVGGDYAFSLTAQEDVIEWISTNVGAPITWGGITGVQRQYLPGELKAELWERDGFQSFNNELEALVNSKIAGNQEAVNVYRSNARELQAGYLAENDDRLERHVNDDQDPHDVTKRQVGLELVENFPAASEAQARGGILHEAFMVPQRTHQAIDELALKPLTAHVSRKDNPHGATYGQVGVFGKVEFDAEVAKKLPRDGTAADTTHLISFMETFKRVFESWKRVSRTASTTYNLTGDPYSDEAMPEEMNSWTFDEVNNRISSTINSVSLVGFISPEKFDEYTLETVLRSTSMDDDYIGLSIAHVQDAKGRWHDLSVLRVGMGSAPMIIAKDFQVNPTWVQNVYGGLKWPDGTVATGPRGVSNTGVGWGTFPAGCKLKVTRARDIITIETSQLGESGYLTSAKTVVDLNSHPELAIFKGPQRFGYLCQSQPQATWEVLQRPGDAKTYSQVYNDVRANLSAQAFETGVFEPARLGIGAANGATVLRGDGTWVSLSSLFQQYSPADQGSVYLLGNLGSEASALNHINVTYSNINAYPIGTIVLFRANYSAAVGTGNGATTVSFDLTRAAVRTGSGWVLG